MIYLEAVPNVSEGRDINRIATWARWWQGRSGVHLLDYSSDPDHHRSVFTVVGEQSALLEALVEWSRAVLSHVDLRFHQGVHPRVGAVDVLPLVPLGAAKMEDARNAAHFLGEKIGAELRQPVYLYAESAPHPERQRLVDLRRGSVQGLSKRAADSAVWRPDFGPSKVGPRTGATAVGARDFLVAFNVILDSDDLQQARSIARQIRASSGGLAGLQAIGVPLASRGQVQVSMNLIDISATSVPTVIATLERLAPSKSLAIDEIELIGLVPRAALAGSSPESFGWSEGCVLETHLDQLGLPSVRS